MRIRSFSILKTEDNPDCVFRPGAIIRSTTLGGSSIQDTVIEIKERPDGGTTVITNNFRLELP